ncbi:hypothetical protein PHAMO_30077 [Magnetospirillum molischianum DSM 120]|uniref:Uncharacterized protein n=1 Tax=Magnetospirillum molischianum DSM 120 TaxID=1150626 RepID=H8FU83_MAGML|nr:hypothetical protein PHAMO_30077 [Magnetospirillum molischianum DSM 120]
MRLDRMNPASRAPSVESLYGISSGTFAPVI